MEEQLFTIIGKLYVEALNSQRVAELLQNKLKDKDAEIQDLKKSKTNVDE
jgi:hypothetical protein